MESQWYALVNFGSDNGMAGLMFVAKPSPSTMVTYFVSWAIVSMFQWNLNQDTTVFVQEN